MSKYPHLDCRLLMTGNELMTGVTVDSNSAFIADQLQSIGLTVRKIVTVGDSLSELIQEINNASSEAQLLIINGGLGPTDDDLTAQALAAACSLTLENNKEAEAHILEWSSRKKIAPNHANMKQALLPANAGIIPNPVGSAVGIHLIHRHCLILCTPGVPNEMHIMIKNQILPLLQQAYPDCRQQFIKRLQVFGIGESSIQQKIHNELPDWPGALELGFRTGVTSLEVKLTVFRKDDLSLRDAWEKKVRDLLGYSVFGEGNDTQASVIVNILKEQGKTLTTAESCTGGMIASMITAIPGSSAVFEAGFVTYADRIKHALLSVDQKALTEFGAVSETVVRQMATGALEKSGADYVIAVSGVAGPDGGSPEKPVGTVWLAWGSLHNIKTRKMFYPAERHFFQLLVSAFSLDLVRREALGITEQPRYFKN